MNQPGLDGAGLAALFDAEAGALYRYLARRVNPAAAEDILSQTFLTAFERRRSFDPERGNCRAWLYGIASKLVQRHRREEIRQLRAYSRFPVESVAGEEISDRVVAAADAQSATRRLAGDLAALADGDRDVLLLFAWASLSYDEIALALDIPAGTVRSRLHRARRQLRAGLATPSLALATETD